MFYYPQFLKNLDFINLQVIFPGGWGQDVDSNKSLHFFLEHALFSPTPNIGDPDEWLWEKVLDFWSITSYESIRLNFTLKPDQVQDFAPFLKALIEPREVPEDFLVSELDDLKTFWQTRRDQKEDAVLRDLFSTENVVHPDPKAIDNLNLSDYPKMLELWKEKTPYLIVCGELKADDLAALSIVGSHKEKFKKVLDYEEPITNQFFSHRERLGWKVELPVSHVYELVLIELWDQIFNTKFFFEYHKNYMYIWTDPVECPHLLEKKIKAFVPTKNQFAKAKHRYLNFLERIYQPNNHQQMEKFAELIEGLHAHDFQAPTYPIDQESLDLRTVIAGVKYDDFLEFYNNFSKASS